MKKWNLFKKITYKLKNKHMKNLELLIENIQTIISSEGEAHEKASAIVYEMVSGNEDDYNKIIKILKGE